MKAKRIPSQDLINRKFSKLTVIEILDATDKFHNRMVRCLCECGGTIEIPRHRLLSGNTGSCGCLVKYNMKILIKKSYISGIHSGRILDPKMGSARRVYRRIYNDGNLTFDDFLVLTQKDCFYCGSPPQNMYNCYNDRNKQKYSKERVSNGNFVYNGLDRVDNNRGHDLDNLVPCCLPCNKAKLDRSKEEFLDWIKKVYDLHCK